MPADSTRRRPTQAERVQAARDCLLDAAAGLVVEQGYHATTAAAIAHRAGLSREMVRVRFGSKLGLMRELLVAEYQEALQIQLPQDTSALEQLRVHADQLASMSTIAPIRLRAAYVLGFEAGTSVPELRNDLIPWLEKVETSFAKLLRDAVAEGMIRDVECDEYARLLVAAATGGAFLFMTSPEKAIDPAAPIHTILDSLSL